MFMMLPLFCSLSPSLCALLEGEIFFLGGPVKGCFPGQNNLK